MSESKLWLLSVGVNDYGAQRQIPNLHNAVNDACVIYQTLTSEYNFEGVLLAHSRDVVRGVHSECIKVTNGSGSREDIIQHINILRQKIGPDDIFVFFYAGHGSAKIPGYLIPFGAEYNKPGSYLMYRTLYGELSTLQCRRQALFFNCCYAGIATRQATDEYYFLDRPDSARVVAFAATSDTDISPDHVPGIAERKYSPFAHVVKDFLLEEIKIGQSFEPEKLSSYLNEQFSLLPFRPTFRGEVPEVRPGRGQFVIRRPGLAINLQPAYRCRVGKTLPIGLDAYRRGPGTGSLQWEITPNEFRATQIDRSELVRSEEEGDRYLLRFNSPGVIPFDFQVTDPDTDESTVRSVEIVVEPAAEIPLTLSQARLDICKKGETYDEFIPFDGGIPLYTGEVKGLPKELTWTLLKRGNGEGSQEYGLHISGTIPESSDTSDVTPVAYDIHFTIKDATGQQCQGDKRLLVISLRDYCYIPDEEFAVGCQLNLEQSRNIREMLEEHVHRRFQGQSESRTVQEVLTQIGNAWNEQIIAQALQTNPGSQVRLGAFYIKKYPVTNAEWRAYVQATENPWIPSHWEARPPYFPYEEAHLPLVNIKYDYIQEYLQWKGTRLPNAWEWEHAARGKDGWLFPWGDKFDPENCNVLDSRIGKLTPVNTYDDKYKSPTGVRDMVGNAAEWVEQRIYARQALAQPFRGGSYLDPCLYALTFKDSTETGVLFGSDEDDVGVGKTDFRWLGFRDVIDLDADPKEPQDLVKIPEIHLETNQPPISPFRMSRYAVSNLEYLEFIRATGHKEPEEWDMHEAVPFPMAQRYLPVVNVGYRDALAFCLWKSRCTECIIRLPTPEQWLAAVDGGEHWTYPWGNDFDPKRCNSLTSGWGKRLPVFALPEGQSKHGIYNLIGNVREWVGPPIQVRGGRWQMDCEAFAELQFKEGVHKRDTFRLKSRDIGFRYVANEPEEIR